MTEPPVTDPPVIDAEEEASEATAMTGEFYGLFSEQVDTEPVPANDASHSNMPRRRSEAHQQALA